MKIGCSQASGIALALVAVFCVAAGCSIRRATFDREGLGSPHGGLPTLRPGDPSEESLKGMLVFSLGNSTITAFRIEALSNPLLPPVLKESLHFESDPLCNSELIRAVPGQNGGSILLNGCARSLRLAPSSGDGRGRSVALWVAEGKGLSPEAGWLESESPKVRNSGFGEQLATAVTAGVQGEVSRLPEFMTLISGTRSPFVLLSDRQSLRSYRVTGTGLELSSAVAQIQEYGSADKPYFNSSDDCNWRNGGGSVSGSARKGNPTILDGFYIAKDTVLLGHTCGAIRLAKIMADGAIRLGPYYGYWRPAGGAGSGTSHAQADIKLIEALSTANSAVAVGWGLRKDKIFAYRIDPGELDFWHAGGAQIPLLDDDGKAIMRDQGTPQTLPASPYSALAVSGKLIALMSPRAVDRKGRVLVERNQVLFFLASSDVSGRVSFEPHPLTPLISLHDEFIPVSIVSLPEGRFRSHTHLFAVSGNRPGVSAEIRLYGESATTGRIELLQSESFGDRIRGSSFVELD